jgi:hypothetical protein
MKQTTKLDALRALGPGGLARQFGPAGSTKPAANVVNLRKEVAQVQERMALPAGIDVASASLPATYENAKRALAECEQIDECKEWADKAAALASYAKQAENQELFDIARRIQARAVRRYGELLREFDGRGGDAKSKSTATDTFAPTQNKVARKAGLSKRKQVTAVRVARVPEEKFEELVEKERPASISELAELGKEPAKAEVSQEGATEKRLTLGSMRRLSSCADYSPTMIADALSEEEHAEFRTLALRIGRWLAEVAESLKEKSGDGA